MCNRWEVVDQEDIGGVTQLTWPGNASVTPQEGPGTSGSPYSDCCHGNQLLNKQPNDNGRLNGLLCNNNQRNAFHAQCHDELRTKAARST